MRLLINVSVKHLVLLITQNGGNMKPQEMLPVLPANISSLESFLLSGGDAMPAFTETLLLKNN